MPERQRPSFRFLRRIAPQALSAALGLDATLDQIPNHHPQIAAAELACALTISIGSTAYDGIKGLRERINQPTIQLLGAEMAEVYREIADTSGWQLNTPLVKAQEQFIHEAYAGAFARFLGSQMEHKLQAGLVPPRQHKQGEKMLVANTIAIALLEQSEAMPLSMLTSLSPDILDQANMTATLASVRARLGDVSRKVILTQQEHSDNGPITLGTIANEARSRILARQKQEKKDKARHSHIASRRRQSRSQI